MFMDKYGAKKKNPANTLFIGVDIAKHRHCARAIVGGSGEDTKAFFFTNRRKGFERLLKRINYWCRKYGIDQIKVGMEPTAGYWKPLYRYLKGLGFEIDIVPSLYVKRNKDVYDNSPLKSDAKDAFIIADLLKSGRVLDYRIRSEEIEDLKKLVHQRDDIVESIGMWKNRLEYFRSVNFPELENVFEDPCCPTALELLRHYPFPSDILEAGFKKIDSLLHKASRGQVGSDKARLLLELAKETIGNQKGTRADYINIHQIVDFLEFLRIQQKEIDKELEEAVQNSDLYYILISVDGIGVVTASAIIAFLGDIREYESARQLIKKAGLNLYCRSSGEHKGKDKISRRGSALLRKYLYMSALNHTKPGGVFYGKYNSLVSRGKEKNKAIVAIMVKLLKVVYALVRDNRLFDPGYESQGLAARNGTVIRCAKTV